MANEKKIKSKIIHKHDTATNWTTAGNNGYIPDKGEFIVYDADSSVAYERIKVGDGVTNINDLPFANDFAEKATQDGDGNVITDTYATKDSLDSKLNKLKFTGGIQFYTEQANGTTLMNGEYGARSGVALRNGTGQLQVGEPTADTHATTKKYVDDAIGDIQDQLDKKVESTTTFIDNEVAYTKKLPQYTSTYAQLNSIGGAAITGEQTIYNFSYQGTDFYVPSGMTWDEFTYKLGVDSTYYEGNTYGSFYDYQGDYVGFQGGGLSITTGPLVEDWVKSDSSVTYTTASGGQTLLPVKVTAIEIKGANMIPFPYTNSSTERNGLKIVVNDDGTITATGTSTVGMSFVYSNVFPGFEHGKTYRIGSGVIISYKNAEGTTKYGETSLTWDDAYTFNQIYYYFAANRAFDVTYYPMINEGTVLHSYAKYSKETISIPQEILALPGYGAGNPNNPTECNSIEWTDEAVKYVQRGSIIDGEWVALDAPVITDITSQIFERNIKVECCGYLTFINDSQAPVPSSVTIHTDNVDVLAADVFVGDLVGEANKAEYAEKDAEGNVIADTYFKNNYSASSLNLRDVYLDGNGIATRHTDGILERIRFLDDSKIELNGRTITASCETFVVNGRVGLDGNGLFLKNQNSDGSVDRWDLHKIDPNDTENSYIGGTRGLTVSSETLYAHNVMVDGAINLYTSGMSEPQPVATQAYVDAKVAESGGGSSSGSGSSGGSAVTTVSIDMSTLTWESLGQIGPDETKDIGWAVSLAAAGIPEGSKAFIWTIHNIGYPKETGYGASGYRCTYSGGKLQITSDRGLVMMGANNPSSDYGSDYLDLVIFS